MAISTKQTFKFDIWRTSHTLSLEFSDLFSISDMVKFKSS